MKLYLISITTIFFLTIVSIPPVMYANFQDNPDDSSNKLAKRLGRGINLSLLEHYWEDPDTLLNTNVVDKINEISKAGFTCIRFPVAFDMFFNPQSINVRTKLIDKLGEAYNTCHSQHISMIITYHYGKLKDNNGSTEKDKILWVWKQVQNKFKGMGYDDLFFELYNEPTLKPEKWYENIHYIVFGLRYEDKSRYYIVGGTNYNSLDELLNFKKLEDDKLFYTFHFYEPYLFTHQGASWTKEISFVTGIPYPYVERYMPPLPPKAKGTDVEGSYNQYPQQGKEEYLKERIKLIATACKQKKMPLICTETGVIASIAFGYRCNYFVDLVKLMRKYEIPTALWDYDQAFSIIKSPGVPLDCLKVFLDK